MIVKELLSATSTNTWLAENRQILTPPILVYALAQTAGRGQRGNSWESEPGKNLTASALLDPAGVLPRHQFFISEAVALAVVDLLAEAGVNARVKWPNDIYVADRKICGILIEHAILPDSIMYSIAGIGVNINQTRFISDAPNPVSLAQITGRSYDIPDMAARLSRCIDRRMEMLHPSRRDGLHAEFMQTLWRADGALYPFFDRLASERIDARIEGVAPDGTLTLSLSDGSSRSYAFKEIEFLL